MQLQIGYGQWYVSCQKFRRLFVSISRKFDGAILRLFSRVPVMITYMCTCVYVLVHSVFLNLVSCLYLTVFVLCFSRKLYSIDHLWRIMFVYGITCINCRRFGIMLSLRVRYCTVYTSFHYFQWWSCYSLILFKSSKLFCNWILILLNWKILQLFW